MAKLVSFFGTTFATSQTETFVGNGGSDTVSYALVGTGVNIGDGARLRVSSSVTKNDFR
jgi:hypothetical protein